MLHFRPRRLFRLMRETPGLMPLALAALLGVGAVLAAPPARAEAARAKASPSARSQASTPARTETGKVHMGLTPKELADFVTKEGWTLVGKVKKTSRMVQFKVPGERLITVYLEDCDTKNRCRAGALSTFSWVPTLPGHVSAWNSKNRGAVAWRTETSLHLTRPIHFRGVTDGYLRELFGEVWPTAVAAWESYFAQVVMGKAKPAPAPSRPPQKKKPPAEKKPPVAQSLPAAKKPPEAKSPPARKKPPANKKPPAKKPAPEPVEDEEEE